MAAVRDRREEFGDDTVIAVVVFTTGALPEYGLPVLRDRDRDAYRAFALGRGSRRRVWGLRAARRYAELIRRGGWRQLRRPVDDSLQLGGDTVIGRDGTVVFLHRSAGPDDRPPVDALVQAARAAATPS